MATNRCADSECITTPAYCVTDALGDPLYACGGMHLAQAIFTASARSAYPAGRGKCTVTTLFALTPSQRSAL